MPEEAHAVLNRPPIVNRLFKGKLCHRKVTLTRVVFRFRQTLQPVRTEVLEVL
jgi:hypothetical protein